MSDGLRVSCPLALGFSSFGSMLLLIVLLVCHYLADFVLTTPSMIAAKAVGKPLLPIAGHAGVHAGLVAVCLAVAGTPAAILAELSGLEWLSHLLIDAGKGLATRQYPTLADNSHKPYWVLFGFDQLLHLVMIVMIWHFALL